jgi:hypothetical protein
MKYTYSYMTDLSKNIRYNATVKTYEFVTTRITGLAHIRTGLIITDTQNVSPYHDAFPHYVIQAQPVTDAIIFNEGSNLLDTMIEQTYTNHPIVIGCQDPQWSYIIYMIVVLMVGVPSSLEHALYGLKYIIDRDTNLPYPTPTTLNRIAIILTNYSIFAKFDENIIKYDAQLMSDEVYRLITDELDRQILMITLIFDGKTFDGKTFDGKTFDGKTYDNSNLETYTTLDPIDPGSPMIDTAPKKNGEYPNMDDCLCITSYAGLEPIPDQEEKRDENRNAQEIEKKFNELKLLMGSKRFNKDYAYNLLQSGMTIEEIISFINLIV